jgi:hypothetical protein
MRYSGKWKKQSAKACDFLSALSIAIVGAISVLFNTRLYPYTSKPSPSKHWHY